MLIGPPPTPATPSVGEITDVDSFALQLRVLRHLPVSGKSVTEIYETLFAKMQAAFDLLRPGYLSPAKDNAPEHWPVTPYSGRIPTKTEKERMRHLEIAVQDLTTPASDASSIAELLDSSQQDASFAENIALGVASIFTPAQVDEDAFKGIAVG
ncbi:hypothetical protein CYMTET_8163 [Cymbomonas tetramitiformis]|uniref:Uncharacterized protein n=1 Tax=Cymbomonas tetramitiformis TaxID=36881 RepID=A0AAE0GU31_9CHLO|nr:hypothetical protein CYMTET_8163 [Cymbomonas tetramitiformis]